MFIAYNPNLKYPEGAKAVETEIAVMNHAPNGMQANTYNGLLLTSDNGILTISIPELKFSLSVNKYIVEGLINQK